MKILFQFVADVRMDRVFHNRPLVYGDIQFFNSGYKTDVVEHAALAGFNNGDELIQSKSDEEVCDLSQVEYSQLKLILEKAVELAQPGADSADIVPVSFSVIVASFPAAFEKIMGFSSGYEHLSVLGGSEAIALRIAKIEAGARDNVLAMISESQ